MPDKIDELQAHIADLLDAYFPEHKDCECSSCLAFIYGIKEKVQALITEARLEAQLNMIDYLDQTPDNKSMDWKGLLADCRQFIGDDLAELQNNGEQK